jgi:hypothetical protein
MQRNYCDACGIEINFHTMRPRIRIIVDEPINRAPYINLETCDKCYMDLMKLLSSWAKRNLLPSQAIQYES